MKLIHTLLFLFRKEYYAQDSAMAMRCLASLERSSHNVCVIYNQGFLSNAQVEDFVKPYHLECIVIGNGENVGTVVGRQSCFSYIWQHRPETAWISEIHLDMVFTDHWEDALLTYLGSHNQPMVACGIVDQNGTMPFRQEQAGAVPEDTAAMQIYLKSLQTDLVVHGFTNPCIHVSKILQEVGGYNQRFLTGKQAFEDDSLLLGYFYHYGTQAQWKPQVNYQSVVYHAVAGQRLGMNDSVMINYQGLLKQYGIQGLAHLSRLHASAWHKQFFSEQYQSEN